MQPWQYISFIVFALTFTILFLTVKIGAKLPRRVSDKLRYIGNVARFSILITIFLMILIKLTILH